MTEQGKRNKGIDILRLICAFLVVCIHAHFPGIVGEYVKAIARVAVPIFFICTGYFLPATLVQITEGKCNNSVIFRGGVQPIS